MQWRFKKIAEMNKIKETIEKMVQKNSESKQLIQCDGCPNRQIILNFVKHCPVKMLKLFRLDQKCWIKTNNYIGILSVNVEY